MKIDLKSILNLGNGYLTYIVAIAMIIVGIYQSDDKLILEGIALFGVRRAISNV